eukprot:SAG31_NODE_4075_length_3612_cov_2.080843_2_plen_408_part_00
MIYNSSAVPVLQYTRDGAGLWRQKCRGAGAAPAPVHDLPDRLHRRCGQAGHLPEFWDDVMDSVWVGGAHDNSGAGHERGPYWLNGAVPLAAALQASGDSYAGVNRTMEVDLHSRVGMWVAYILEHQLPNGWLGPDDNFGGKGSDYWSGWNVALALLQYADANSHGPSGDCTIAAKCEAAVLAYVLETHRRMLINSTSSWSQLRWQDWVAIIHQLMDQAPQNHEQALWDAAELTFTQSWDWDAYYHRTGVGGEGALRNKTIAKFPLGDIAGYWNLIDHGVNNAQATKGPAVWRRQNHNVSYCAEARYRLDMQDKYHGQPNGMFAADECFAGRMLSRGTELCTVVEQLHSLRMSFQSCGDLYFLDKAERIVFNALPGTLGPTQWHHQYLQQANEINALYNRSDRDHIWK